MNSTQHNLGLDVIDSDVLERIFSLFGIEISDSDWIHLDPTGLTAFVVKQSKGS